mmetsp:Transcript_5780/g.18390  ORF Transcript_5780/g.18390 Transcript_5780/m.18390 type:complete len:251 (+) Transcript_5780:1044-1796(+)
MSRPTNGIHLVKEDDARLLGPRHLKQLPHHARALADVLLHQLRTDHTDEAGVRAVRYRTRRQRLARPRRAVQQHALGRIDPQVDEPLRVKQREFQHLAQLLKRLACTAHVVIRHIRLLLHRHHGHRGVDTRWQRNLDGILCAVHAHAHALLDVGWRHLLTKRDHELGDRLECDHVLGFLGARVDDLGAPCHLQWLLFLQHLLVRDQIPRRRRRQPRVGLLHADELDNPLLDFINVLLDALDGRRVRPLSV